MSLSYWIGFSLENCACQGRKPSSKVELTELGTGSYQVGSGTWQDPSEVGKPKGKPKPQELSFRKNPGTNSLWRVLLQGSPPALRRGSFLEEAQAILRPYVLAHISSQ